MKISAVIIARDEEQKIAAAIRSVEWADEVLVVDSESIDRTPDIAAELGARVIVRTWPGFSAQKQFAAEAATNDWIFSLDADERVSPELRDEILSIQARGEPAVAGFRVPRLSTYLGREIRHSGWYPDWQMRLFDRRRASWNGNIVHESVQVHAGESIGQCRGNILHNTIGTIAEHEELLRTRYAPLGAKQMMERGKRTSPLRVAAAGPVAFLQTYILKAGFLDGKPGFHIARMAARHARLKHLILLDLQRGKG